MKIILYKTCGGFSFSDKAEEELEQLGVMVDELWDEDIKSEVRINPIVIDYIEKNIESCQPRFWNGEIQSLALQVVEIPDDSHWLVEINDVGYETLHYSKTEIKTL